MKKWFFIWMVCLMLVFCTGCGSSEEDISGTIEQSQETGEDKPVTLGRFEGGVYKNKYLGLGCELNTDWTYLSAEELQEIPEAVKESFGESDIAESMADAYQIMDMKAENTVDLTSVNILYTKVDVGERVTALTKGEEFVVDSVLEQADMMKEGYEEAGILVHEMKKVKVNFLGEERTAIFTAAETQEIPYYTLQLFDYSSGKYSATITFASYMEDKTEELLTIFHKLDS